MIIEKRRQKNVGVSAGHLQEQTDSEKLNRCALENNTSQRSRLPRAGIDVDAVVAKIGMRNWCVPMNNALAVMMCRVEELAADPEQVMHRLPIERDTWANARMHEQVIAAADPRLQTSQK